MAAGNGPSPCTRHPIAGVTRTAFLEAIVTRAGIEVGDYSYYDDPRGPERFEDNVLYRFDEATIARLLAPGLVGLGHRAHRQRRAGADGGLRVCEKFGRRRERVGWRARQGVWRENEGEGQAK